MLRLRTEPCHAKKGANYISTGARTYRTPPMMDAGGLENRRFEILHERLQLLVSLDATGDEG